MPTIYESFRQAVDLEHPGSGRRVAGGPDGNVHVSAPSNATKRYEPPNFLLKTPESKWLSIADDALDKHKSRLNQKSTRLAPWESNMRMNSEGDVIYGSAIYLNNPVHIALHEAQNHSRSCEVRSEVTLSTTSRADMGYFHNGQAYAILEYKKPGAVSERCARGDFERGVPKDSTMFAAWMSRADKRFMRDVRGGEDTRFLLQQAVHYQNKFNVRFVALFDWNSLVLLVLPQCQGLGLNDRVSYGYITEVTDNRKFRRALLGFLLTSYRHHTRASPGAMERIRPDVFSAYAQDYRRRVADRSRHQQASGHFVPDDKSTGRGPTPQRYANPHTNTRTTASSTYSNDTNSTIIHTYITLPGRNETKSPGVRLQKQPGQRFAAQYGGSSGVAVNTPNRGRGGGRPRQVPPISTVGDGYGSYSASEYSYGGTNYTKSTPRQLGTHNGNGYHAYPGPSGHKDNLAGNHSREKSGGKFLGIFKTR